MKYCSFLLPFLLLCVTAAAQDVPATEAMGILGIPRSSVRSGMAGAGSASVTAPAAFAAFDNPAVLPWATNKVEAALSYGRWAPSATGGSLSDNIGAAVAGKPFRALALSAAVVNQAHPVMDFGGDYGSFKPLDGMAALGAGVSFGKHFSLGASFIFAQQRLMADYTLNAFAFNVMAQYHAAHFDVTAGVINAGGKVKAENGTAYPLPASARLGGDYHTSFGKSGIEAALDADCYFTGKFGASLGLQYSYNDLLFARAGYRYATQGAALPSHFALGLGVKWKGFRLDGSFLTANPNIGNSFLITIGYCY